ncbi:hypothetical protein FRC03_010817 [Tulasnella sp. 419]|nr:hypothetical protein FRC03_010817 [Tulasnella sp. 419]
MKSQLALLATAVASANAHTIMQKLWVNGVDQGYLKGIRHPTYDGPILDVNSNDIICNGGPNPLVTPYPTEIIDIPAGATVTTEWHHDLQPNGYNANDSDDPIAKGHSGPIIHYLAKVDSALKTDVTGLKWFKIHEEGMYSDGTWAVDKLYNQKGKWDFKIPSCIPPGNYLLRAEIIALHPASSYPGAQFYMECAQINITGGGSASPSTVSFPGAYHGSDPGITINIYYPPVTSYTIPGPPVFTCPGSSGSSSSTSAKPSSSSSSSVKSSSSSTTPTSSSSSATSTATGTVAHYAQCGGTGFTGPTICVPPYVCTKSNDFFSQCL